MPTQRVIILFIAGVLFCIAVVSESRCSDGPPPTEPSTHAISEELWRNRRETTGFARSGLRDRLLLCDRGRCVLAEASGKSQTGIGDGLAWDAAVLGGETTTLVQTGPNRLEIGFGKQVEKKQSLAPQFQCLQIMGAVIDPSRRRILTISLDHVDSTYLNRDDVYGPGSLQLISMDGTVLCTGFDFPEMPRQIRRDETCTRVAVLTERRVYLFKVEQRGFDLVGYSNVLNNGPYKIDFASDGTRLLVGGYDWVECLASEGLKTLWRRNCPEQIRSVVCTEKFCAWFVKNRIYVKLVEPHRDDVLSIDIGDNCFGVCSVYSDIGNYIAAGFVCDIEDGVMMKIYNAEGLSEKTAFTIQTPGATVGRKP